MNSKAIRKQLFAAVAMVLVAAVALGSSTYAWFVSNTGVRATSSSVTAASSSTNLLIVAGAQVAKNVGINTDGVSGNYVAAITGGKTADAVTSTNATALMPASTDNCADWYVVGGWESTEAGKQVANAYNKPTILPVSAGTNVVNGQYTLGGNATNAYQASTYSIYTTTGTVDLNLDPTNPITVEVAAENATLTDAGFKDALRVGIVVDGVLKLVYAPTAESGDTGNDKDAQAGYRTVASDKASTTAATYAHVEGTTFTGWTATANGDGTYTKATNSLGTVGTAGTVVQIFVWLEGTDKDCITGVADATKNDDTYKVTINFAGGTTTA